MNIVNVGYDSTNYYLLALAKGYLMVDAGWPNTLPKLVNACKRKSVALAQIEYLFVTHFHPDHAGLVQELKQTGARLIMPDVQRAAIAPSGRILKNEHHYVEIDLADNIDLPLAETRRFLGGIGLRAEIIATPGHSDDSLTLVLDEGPAFTGDLGPLLEGGSNEATIHSWERIRALGAKTVYPGHGPVRQVVF